MTRGRKKAYLREDVVERAMKLFWKKGYEGSHLKELVEVTGLNRFSLYKEFGGKEGLFLASIEHYLSLSREYYRSSLEQTPLGIQNIKNYFESIEFEEGYYGCFFISSLRERFVLSRDSYETVSSFTFEIEQMYLKNLLAAQKRGDLSKEKNTKALAQYFLSVDEGLSLLGLTHSKSKFLKDISKIVTSML